MCEVGVASGACLLGVHSLIFLSSLILGRTDAAVWFCLVLIGILSTNSSVVPVLHIP